MNTSLNEQELIPDEVYQEAQLNDAFDLVNSYMDYAQAKLSATIQHYGHAVDVTEYPFVCTTCEVTIDGK